MKTIKLLIILFISTITGILAQEKVPDTLIISTKNGKIILVGDSLEKFSGFNSNEVINKALYKIRDSLTIEQKRVLYNKHRDSLYTRKIKGKSPFRMLPVVGLGMIRDKVSPFLGWSIDFAPQRQDYYLKGGGLYTFINWAAVPYFTFDKDINSEYKTHHNIFLEGSFGNRINNESNYGSLSEVSFGLGYLLRQNGLYFKNNTFKVFVTAGIKNSFVKIRPELFVTDNFNSIFPGISLKIF